jgi:hypothetical protein
MNMNPTRKGAIINMEKPLPDSEDDRTAEALALCDLISPEDYPKISTWELQTIQDVKAGKAATKVRLREIREVVKRLQTQ